MEGFTSKYTDEQVEALLDVVAEGGGESASAMEYYDISQLDETTKMMVVTCTSLSKTDGDILPTALLPELDLTYANVERIALVSSAKIYTGGYISTIRETISATVGYDLLASLPRLTEEEFYATIK